MKRKGISPLVAVIMLIAFTLIVAGILAGWATNFAQKQREDIDYCANARVLLMKGVYIPGDSTLNLVVYNLGGVDLEMTTMLEYSNMTRHPDIIETWGEIFNVTAGATKTIVITDVSDDLKEVTVRSAKCPGTQDLLSKMYITGL